MKSITPLFDRVVVKVAVEESTSAAGLVLVAKNEADVTEGIVLAVGPGRYDPANPGVLTAAPVEVGDVVAYARYGGNRFDTELDGTVIVLHPNDLMGIVES